jgi:DNA-binding HxlR family transcriptional regulator
VHSISNFLDPRPGTDNPSRMKSSRPSQRVKRGAKTAGPEQILGLFVNNWAIKIVQTLDRSPKLYTELEREFRSAPQSALSHTLRDLQDAGLVWRKAYPTSAARVEYSLTSLGKSFISPLVAFCEWADLHERELSAASARRMKQSKRSDKRKQTPASRPVPNVTG